MKLPQATDGSDAIAVAGEPLPEPTPRQEIRYMERASRAASKMGSAGRCWLLRWLRDNYPEDWSHVRRNG